MWWVRHNNVVGLNRLMGFPSWISNGVTYIDKRQNMLVKEWVSE